MEDKDELSSVVEKELRAQRPRRRLATVLRAAGALVMALATILVGQNAVDNLSGPTAYRIIIAGDFNLSQAAVELRDELQECSLKVSSLDGRPVEIIHQDHIAGNAQLTAETLAARSDTLMVVGHFTSTATSKALPVYLGQAAPIPVLLTTETNPNLTKFDGEATPPVLRLWPTDEKQAEDAADYAAEKGTTFWIVEDASTNPVYSQYLAREFATNVLTKKGNKVVLRSDNRALPSPEALRHYDIDAVFFPGGWQDALVLIHAINSVWPENSEERPKIFLTDGSADYNQRLIDLGGAEIDGVFVTHPAPPDHYMRKEIQSNVAGQTCARINRLLAKTVERIPEQKAELPRLFSHHSMNYARRALADAMLSRGGGKGSGTDSGPASDLERGSDTPKHAKCNSFYLWKAKQENGGIIFKDESTNLCPR